MLLASSVPASSADHTLTGKRLVAKSRNGKQSFVWISKDAQALFPAESPTSVGATLKVSAADGDVRGIDLSPGRWRQNAAGTKAQYSNPDAPGGDSPCKAAMIAGGKGLKVVCREDFIDTLDAGAEGSVDVMLLVGGDRYCASFGGVVRDETGLFVAAGAPAPAACPPADCPVTTTTTLPLCGDLELCEESECPSPQVCADDGLGGCGCVGDPVPCDSVDPVGLCALGDCPPGLQCALLRHPYPDCFNSCSCQ
jgi:hypothetical protein